MLIKHGWHGFNALATLVRYETDQAFFKDYMASLLKVFTESFVSFAGGKLELPSYIEAIHEEKVKDTRTAEEIKAHVLSLFQAGEEEG